MSDPDEPLADVRMATAALNALEISAARRDGRPLGTLDVLLGILAVDETGDWNGVQLQATFISDDDVSAFPDPDSEVGGTWHNVPLTRTATTALATAVRIAEEYRLLPMPPGVLALGLLAEPRAGATRALLQEASVDHAGLLSLVQDAILGTELEGFEPRPAKRGDALVAATRRFSRRGLKRGRGGTAPAAMAEAGPFEQRALMRARQLDGGIESPSSLALLIACVESDADEELEALLESMLLDPQELRVIAARLAELPDAAAEAAIERARGRTDGAPGPGELIAAVALLASPRLAEALRLRALTPNEVAAQVADLRLAQDATPTTRVMVTSLVAVAGSVVTTLLVVLHAIHHKRWWELVLLPPIWWGYPQEGPLFGAVVALVLGVVVAPAVGIAQAASVVAEIAQADAERLARWPRTGVHLTLREQRFVTLRLLNGRARAMRMLRQAMVMRRRGGEATATERT